MADASKPPLTAVGNGAEDWLTPGRFALLLGAFILALFPDVALGTRTFFFRDYGLYGYPVAFYHREAFWQGEMPLWNPLSNSGIPFHAEWSMLTLYPFSFIYLLLPLTWALGVFSLLHLFLGGMGMYWLATSWTGNRLAGAFAGVAFTFNGFMLSCLIWPHHMVSVGWMPWVLLAVRSAWEKGGRSIIWAALIASMQMLGGPPEVILATWLLLAALWLGQLAFEIASRRQIALRVIGVVALVTGLCAAQIFPFLQFLSQSQRDRDFGGATWSLPATGWGNLFVPLLNQSETSAGVYMFPEQGIATSYFAGIAVLLLAVFAAVWTRNWRCWVLTLCTVASLTLALGDQSPLYPTLRGVFPQIGFMRYPVKFIIPLTVLFPLLAAWALAALMQAPAGLHWRKFRSLGLGMVVFLVFIGLLLWWNRLVPLVEEPWAVTAWNGCVRAIFLLVTLGALFLLFRVKQRLHRSLLGVIIVTLIWGDLASHVPTQNPTVQLGAYEPGLPTITALAPKPAIGHSRLLLTVHAMLEQKMLGDPFNHYLAHRLIQYQNVNFYEQTPKVDGFYSLYLREERELRNALHSGTNTYRAPIADFLSVSQVTSDKDIFTFSARTNFLPMITAGQQPVFADKTNILALMMQTNWNPHEVVLLPLADQAKVAATHFSSARILDSEWRAHRIKFTVEAEKPTLAVLSQAHYQPWKADVSGQPAPILRANHAFQAIPIPAGRSTVTLTYLDRLFQGSLVAAWFSMWLCLALLWKWKPKARLSL